MMRIILTAKQPLIELEWDFFLHPFNRFSPFNRPIGTGAQYAGSGHAMTEAWNRIGFNQLSTNNGLGFNAYRNSPTDPVRTIQWGGIGTGDNLPITVRAPWMRNPDPTGSEQDSATILYDTVDGEDRFLEFARFRGGDASPWTSRACNIISPYGTGREAGASASDIAGLGLAVRAHELDADFGPIRRAIGISLNARVSPAQLGAFVVWPAKHTDSACGSGYACDGPIPYGQLFALPTSVDIGALGLTTLGVRVAIQMRDYGMYAVDNGGQNCRSDQFVPAAVRTDFINSMRIIKPLLRAVLNNQSTDTQPTCSGGGTPVASNGAFDS